MDEDCNQGKDDYSDIQDRALGARRVLYLMRKRTMYVRSRHTDHYNQGHCWPNGCPKQDCIIVPPPSNIMEVLKATYHRGQNRTLSDTKFKIEQRALSASTS